LGPERAIAFFAQKTLDGAQKTVFVFDDEHSLAPTRVTPLMFLFDHLFCLWDPGFADADLWAWLFGQRLSARQKR
jgi:hypothetical protein